MNLPLRTGYCFLMIFFLCIGASSVSAQSVWRYQTRAITVVENSRSKIAIFRDSSKNTPSQQRTATDDCPDNIDFEKGNFNNWQCYIGTASTTGTGSSQVNVVNSLSAVSPQSNRHTMITPTSTPSLDPYGNFPTLCPNGSGYSIKLGNSGTGAQAERVRYTFTVPVGQNDFNLIYNYAVVFQNPQSNHTVAQQPRFQAKVYDAVTGVGIDCANYDFIATAGLPGFTVSNCNSCSPASNAANPVLYKSWTPVTINLSGFAGRSMILEFTTEDCTLSAHFGYAYIDVNSGCNGLVSGAAYCQGATSVKLTAPPGYQAYNWYNNDYTQLLGTGQIITLTPPPPVNSIIRIDLVPYPGFGCRDTVYTTVSVNPLPVAKYNADSTPICQGANLFNFVNTSTITAGTMTYLWKFGDGNTSTTASPVKSFAAPGVYNVKMVATSNIGCKDSITKVYTVLANPSATFDILSPLRQCIDGNSFDFNNTSPPYGTGVTYTWNFGDGGNSSVNTPNHVYTASGNYNVKLLAVQTTNASCKDSITKAIIVEPKPTAAIGFYNSGRQCFNNNAFRFKNNSTSPAPLTYEWFFGDGNSSTAAEPIYSYAAPGTYTVKLVSSGFGTCKDSITTQVIVDPSPDANFNITSNINQCQDNNLFTFQDVSTIADGSPLTYSWSFADAGTSTLQNPQHNYSLSGTYQVQLIAIAASGCTDTITKPILVDPKPVPDFSVTGGNEQCFRSNNFSFQNGTTISTGSFTQTWSFGDGGTAAGLNVNHTYVAVGSYPVKIIATSNNGCIDSITKNIEVNPEPVAAFTIDDTTQCLRGNSFRFTNASTIVIGTLTHTWQFGDLTTSPLEHPVKTYATHAPSYSVMLVAKSAKNCKDTAYKNVYLYQHPLSAFNIVTNAQQCEKGNNFQFTNASTFPTGLTYQWLFGDGNTSTQLNAFNHYTTNGNYNVKLVSITNENACTDTATKTIEVVKNPGATFSINNASQCLTGNNFSFSNAPAGTTYQYNWAFGDGGTANTSAPSHNYTTVGNYTVRLIVDNNAVPGLTCSDTATQPVIINPMPTGFITNKGTYDLCQGSLKMLTASGGITYQWFQNGAAVPGANAATFGADAEGFYTVDAINQFGCRAKAADTAFINEIRKPTANFIYDSYCINKTVKFINTTTPGAHNIVRYSWDLGHNGSTDTATNPLHTYSPAGIYHIKLAVTSTLCPLHLSVMEKDIKIEEPLVGRRYSTINAVVGNTYFLTARTGGIKYQWTPAVDLNDPASRTPILTATAERDYKVLVTTSSGCQAVDSLKILIFNQSAVLVPKAFTPNGDGLNDKLYPILVGIKQLKYFRVYNRWGNLVFSTANAQTGWDGYYKGALQPTETFTWVAEAVDAKGNIIHNGGNTILVR